MNENKQKKNIYREIGTIAAFLVLSGLMVIFLPPVQADTPTVTITDYKVTPSVLMPDSLGTITVTIKNTATSASQGFVCRYWLALATRRSSMGIP